MKKILCVIAGLGFALTMILNFQFHEEMGRSSDISLAILTQSEAGEEGCITTPGGNSGVCRANVTGGYSCVDPYWWQSPDCSAS